MLRARRRVLSRGRRRPSCDVWLADAPARGTRHSGTWHPGTRHFGTRPSRSAPSAKHSAPGPPMICCLVLDASCAASSVELDAIARACSPRVESHGGGMVFDAAGLARVLGPPADIAREVHRLGTDRGLTLRVAIARTTTPAWLLAHARAGTTVVSAE